MNQKDRKKFQDCLLKAKVSLPGPNLNRDELVARDLVFWEAIEKYSIESIETAFKWARENLSFFPTPKDIIQEIERRKPTIDDKRQIEWAEPTEEGRKIARECLDFVLNRIEQREAEEKKERDKRFKARRVELKKQAKLLEP